MLPGRAMRSRSSTRTSRPPFSRPVTHVEPRSLPTPLVDQLAAAPETVDAAALLPEIMDAIADGGGDEYLPFAGLSAGLIDSVQPVIDIIHDTVTGAATILSQLGHGSTTRRPSSLQASIAGVV